MMPGIIIVHSHYHNNGISNFKLNQSDKASSYLMLVEKTSCHTCRETYRSIGKRGKCKSGVSCFISLAKLLLEVQPSFKDFAIIFQILFFLFYL
jgi:hypothetical protein